MQGEIQLIIGVLSFLQTILLFDKGLSGAFVIIRKYIIGLFYDLMAVIVKRFGRMKLQPHRNTSRSEGRVQGI